jgi:hypothetical protein
MLHLVGFDFIEFITVSQIYKTHGVKSVTFLGTARPLTESDIPDAVKYNFDLLKMSILLLETCRAI